MDAAAVGLAIRRIGLMSEKLTSTDSNDTDDDSPCSSSGSAIGTDVSSPLPESGVAAGVAFGNTRLIGFWSGEVMRRVGCAVDAPRIPRSSLTRLITWLGSNGFSRTPFAPES